MAPPRGAYTRTPKRLEHQAKLRALRVKLPAVEVPKDSWWTKPKTREEFTKVHQQEVPRMQATSRTKATFADRDRG
jgi:hypothetical protein